VSARGVAQPAVAPPAADAADHTVLRWAAVELAAIRAANPGPPRVSRGLAIVHTATYDAWAAYDAVALGTTPASAALRRPAVEHTGANKRRAVSFAAYRALADLYPGQRALFDATLVELGYDPADAGAAGTDPAAIGVAAADAVLAARRHDGANQLGDLNPGAYSDWTGYQPVNSPDRVTDPTRWQPQLAPNPAGVWVAQRFLAPHWGRVRPFALADGAQLRPAAPRAMEQHGAYSKQVEETLRYSAGLDDKEKAISEYWADGPNSETPPGHWCLMAEWVARRDHLGLDDQVRLFFVLSNAVMDAGIAAWDAKRAYDAVRPITAVRVLKAGKPVRAWGGPGAGTVWMLGEAWRPYQPATFVTPPFPEFVSGHSTFSMAAATVLAQFTGSDAFGLAVSIPAGSSRIEPGLTPSRAVTLAWPTFSAAAAEAGLSRRYGGIHFVEGDLAGRALGRQVGLLVWARAAAYWNGTATSPTTVATR
jgi:membrane-associated phospholipid phosphatase